jgi:hypothetical protein
MYAVTKSLLSRAEERPLWSSDTPPTSRGFRDLRIDALRGICLLLIFIDHVPNNVLSWFTLQRFAFIDCADVFVFISGYVSGLVFTRLFMRDGLNVCVRKAWRRVGQLYLAHILISGIALVVFYEFLRYNVVVPDRSVYIFMDHPLWTAAQIALLQHMPNLLSIPLGILPMFIILLAFAPILAWALSKKHGAVLFLILTAVYTTTLCFPRLNFYSYPGHIPWGMDVFAWQLVFALGFLFANRTACGEGTLSWIRRRHVIAAIAGLLVIAVVRIGPTSHLFARITHTYALWQALPSPLPLTGKLTAQPFRILNLLMMALVVSAFGRQHRFWNLPVFRPFIACGQNSLVVFSVGVILSVLASCIALHFGTRWIPVLLTVAGCLVLIIVGQGIRRMRTRATRALSFHAQAPVPG